jgi:rare lipoprotein A
VASTPKPEPRHRHARRPAPLARRWIGLSLPLWLAACGQLPQEPVRHAPLSPPVPQAKASYPDAVPRVEPRSRLGNPPYYVVDGRRYVVLDTAHGFSERGIASW